jgi:hypothetical protein
MDHRVELLLDLIKEYAPDRIVDPDEIAKILKRQDRRRRTGSARDAQDRIREVLRKLSVRDPSTMTFEEFEQYIHRKIGI